MTTADSERVLVLAPTSADEAQSRSILTEAGLAYQVCHDLAELCREIGAGAGALLLTEEALAAADASGLVDALRRQPRWSDLPTLLLCGSGADSSAAVGAMEQLGSVTILERPVRPTTLVSALRAALQARRRQYELRDQMDSLRESEERLRLALSAGRVGVWDWNLVSDALSWSETLFEIHGIRPEQFSGSVEAFRKLVHPDDAARVEAAILRCLEEGATYEIEFRIQRPDGQVRWVFTDARVIRDAAGVAQRLVGATTDVTERKNADQSRALLAAIVESSEDAMVSKSLDGVITSWNRGAERLFGYTAEEAVGRSILMLVPPERHAEEHVILDRLRRGERLEHFETVRLTRDGQRIDLSLTVSPVRDASGAIIGASKVSRDITARKHAEQTLRKQGERLRLLWEAAAVLLTTEEPDAMLKGVFARIAPQLGLDAYFNFMMDEGGDGLRVASWAGIPDEDVPGILRLRLGESVSGGVALHRKPVMITHIQQSEDPTVQLCKRLGMRAYACNPLLVEGRLLGTLSFASRQRDFFDADELEFLETICHYVTIAYERVRLIGQLRESDRRKDEFLATLAHELRNPLAPIRNALQIMQLTGNDAAAVEQGRLMMERQLGQMVRLIDDLLDMSRITRGKLELRKERIELSAVVRNATDTARPLLEASGHGLTLTLPEEPVYVDADPVRLAQVFANLLNNAAKYMERGGHVWLGVERHGAEAHVSVRDTGIGIPAEALPSIFDMFTQVDRSLERSHGGLGIGLTLVKRLLEMHGGHIEARSEGVGKGAEFVVRLPAVPAAAASAPLRDDPARAESLARYRILVADDNADAAESMGILLRLQGHEVRIVRDGVQAVEEAAAFRPDLVLLDIGMPHLNGYDAAREIRAQRWGQRMVLVALTGWGQEEDKRRALEAGFDRHFTKPVKPDDIQKLVAALRPPTLPS